MTKHNSVDRVHGYQECKDTNKLNIDKCIYDMDK